ncbi:uncharacterized protein [Nicotiana sylvestris]
MKSTEKFIKFADDSLRPYVEQNLRVETLRLLSLRDQELASHIDRWLNLVIKLNVRSLEIYAMYNLKYSVPDAIYAAKTLTELSLRGCNFEIDNSTNKLQRLITTCPLIRDLKISRCWGIQNLLVFGLVNLEKLELRSCEGLEKVEIQAPNLREFVYVGVPLHKCPKVREPKLLPCTIDILDGYKTLEYLYLEATTMTDKQFEYRLSKFTALEVLDLRECYIMKNIKVMSEKLKKFTLWNWRNLEQVNVLAPNLVAFDFESGKTCMPFSTMDPSNLERAKINFYLRSSDDSYHFGDVDTSWYNNLQGFVQKFNYSNGLILVIRCRKDQSILIYEDPREIIVPPTRELEICIKNPSMYPEKFTHDLMLGRPNIISIVPCRESKLVQVFQETITRYKAEQNRRLDEVINHKGATENGETSRLYSWLKSTPLIERITTFTFKWKEPPFS